LFECPATAEESVFYDAVFLMITKDLSLL